jgi:hypothetical protein
MRTRGALICFEFLARDRASSTSTITLAETSVFVRLRNDSSSHGFSAALRECHQSRNESGNPLREVSVGTYIDVRKNFMVRASTLAPRYRSRIDGGRCYCLAHTSARGCPTAQDTFGRQAH